MTGSLRQLRLGSSLFCDSLQGSFLFLSVLSTSCFSLMVMPGCDRGLVVFVVKFGNLAKLGSDVVAPENVRCKRGGICFTEIVLF